MVAGLLPLLLVLAATFVYAGIAAGSNAYQIKRDFNISHLWETRERIAAVVGFVVLAYAGHRFGRWWNFAAPPLALGAAACLFGLRFDIRLNLRRLLPRHYLGTDPNTAATDKAVTGRGMSGRTFAWLKLAGVVALSGAALLLSGCKASQPERAAPHSTTAPGIIAQVPGIIAQPAQPPDLTPAQVAHLPARVQRQYRKNLKAQPRMVPLIQGRAAVNAPAATSVATSYKNAAPVTLATDSAVVNVSTAGKSGQAAAGPGIVQTRTEAPKRTVWQRVAGLLTGLTSTIGWLLLGAVLLHGLAPGVGYGTGWLRRFVSRRRV
ncbi:hypothetical protein [Hymenobacter lapidiphilus]|uniref:Uncharacterized protein n=1 Tax=Hymenobacter lapidiphilus TaxID=2608003 RepID=A0A7Y7U8D8_9BACT|nr:hypothetical protein [Hymenobacter lapidiphilus]NVO33465.1 hypothetical protein [Hymenobacter lapidiphilus]